MKGAAKKDPFIGQVIAGRYEVVKLIGKGGMGAIYECRHKKLKRVFALKRLAAALADDAEAMARFQREADVVATLRHPNIVEIVDWETLEDGTPCMIMEYLRGEDLGARIKRGGPLSWADLAQIVDPILAGLSVAHRAGIVHRDLKPQNIFLARDDSDDEHPKLLDFGVSKIRHSESLMTGDDRLLGTPAYMSPEQADGRPDQIGPATDVWAMGAILYEMAGARQAFTGSSTPSVLYRICHGQPEPLNRPDAPPAFIELIACALSRDEKRRIRSVDELRRRLREALAPVAAGAFHEPLRSSAPAATPVDEATSQMPMLTMGAAEKTTMTPVRTTLSRATGQKSLSGAAILRQPGWTRQQWGVVGGLGALVAVASVAALLSRPAPAPPLSTPVVTPMATAPPPAAVPPPVAAPPPAAAPPPRVASPPVVAPPTATLVLHVLPAGAHLTLDGAPVSGDGLVLPRDGKRHRLRANAAGYLPEERELDASTRGPLSISLSRREPPRRRPEPSAPRPHETPKPPAQKTVGPLKI